MSRTSLCTAATIAALALAPIGSARAQTVSVQGQDQADPYGQPQGYAQPPPGYGQQQPYPQQQPYTQPYQQPYAPTYAPTYAPPPRRIHYENVQTSIKALWVPGIIAFGVGWVLTGTFGSFSTNSDYNTWTWIPLIGPWVALTYANNADETGGAVVGGIAQIAGLAMFVLGLTLTRTVRVARYSSNEADPRSPQLALDVLPAPGGAQIGLAISHF